MLFLTTLKGITRDGSLETIAEVAHPGAGGDASEVCNRYQDVISSTPEGDALRARYAQVLFILDNQVRSQLEFPPPSLEVTAESTGSGEGNLSGEGGAGESILKHPVSKEDFAILLADAAKAGIIFPEGSTKEEMIQILLERYDASELTNHGDPVSTGEGDLSGGGQSAGEGEPDLLSGAGSGEAKPGSLSPKGKGKGK